MKKAGEEVSLSPEQRAHMRRTIHAYMEMKPLRTPAPAPGMSFSWFLTMRPVAAVLVFALFISSGGISYAAETALPGDLLYPIKTHVNEPVQGALAVSSAAKTAWAMDVAGTRVQEAATLAAEGRLGTTTQQELQADFEQHAADATRAIAQDASSSPDGSSEAAVRFEAQLSEYENVLSQIGAAKNIDVSSLAISVKKQRNEIAAVRAQTESTIASTDTDHSAAARMGIAARAQLEASSKLARAVSESLSSSSAQIVAAQLDDASNSISIGEDLAAKSAAPAALGAFQNALSATEKLGVFLNTSSAIHARTGLVVGEPAQQEDSKKSPRINRNNDGRYADEGNPRGTAILAAKLNVAAMMAATSSVTATTTSTGDSGTSTRSSDDASDSRRHDTREAPNLPIAVPVNISF